MSDEEENVSENNNLVGRSMSSSSADRRLGSTDSDNDDPLRSPSRKSESGKFEHLSTSPTEEENAQSNHKLQNDNHLDFKDSHSEGENSDTESHGDHVMETLNINDEETDTKADDPLNQGSDNDHQVQESSNEIDISTELNLHELDSHTSKDHTSQEEEVDTAGHDGKPELDTSEKIAAKFEDKKEDSSKERRASSSSEQRSLSEKDEKEEADELTDLAAVAEKIDQKQSKDSGDDYDYDFSALEPLSSPLNVEAGKQRALLRQKGSLAGRRKPTRASLRATAAESQLVITGTDDDKDEKKPVMNGHVEELEDTQTDRQKDDIKPDTNTSQASVSEGPVLSTGKTIQGVKTAMILPGISDLAANKSKLRQSKPPVPLPRRDKEGTAKPTTSSSEPPSTEQPPQPSWLTESKLRRQSRPPRGEVEKLQQEAEPERPAWMKDAEMKHKRVSNLVSDQQKEQKDKQNETEQQDQTPVAPWMKERQLRKINRPGPMTIAHKEILHNIDNVTILEHDNPFIGKTGPSDGSPSDNKEVKSKGESSDKISAVYSKPPAKLKQSSIIKEDIPMPKSERNNREILQPIKKPDTSHVQEQDENIPPQSMETSKVTKDTAILRTKEMPPSKSNVLPPLRTPVKTPSVDSSNEEHSTPSPTHSVVMREKPATPNKPFTRSRPITVGPVSVDSPMKMWETPKWKKDLMEKKRKRETLNPGFEDKQHQQEEGSQNGVDDSLPPWKRELQARKAKRSSVRIPTAKDEEGSSESIQTPVPEWMKQVQRRRSSRLSSAGLLKEESKGEP